MKNTSNLSNVDYLKESAIISLDFEEKFNNETHNGKITIKGLKLPHNPKFSPLDKIWSSVRKRIAEEHGIQVTGIFFPGGNDEIIGNFLLNMAAVDKEDQNQMMEKFEGTFRQNMCRFESAIETWIMANDGLIAYMEYVEQGHPDPSHCNELFDEFLISAGIKTKKDIEERREKEKRKKRSNVFDLFRRFALEDE